MGNNSFKMFLAKIQNDESMKQELRAASGETTMPVEALIAFAAGKGYEFKVEDVSSELSDAALDNVAGGGAQPHMAGSTLVHDISVLKIDGLNAYLSSAGITFQKC
jgi:predicted ribosomally synthesized peptide with nif11-like leader